MQRLKASRLMNVQVKVLFGNAWSLRMHSKVTVDLPQLRLVKPADLLDRLNRFKIGDARDGGDAILTDSCSCRGARLAAIAQNGGMPELNRSNQCDLRADHVGGVEAATQPDFDHGDIDPFASEVLNRQGRRRLEESRRIRQSRRDLTNF